MDRLIAALVILLVLVIFIGWGVNSQNSTVETMEPLTGDFPFPTFVINLDRKPQRYDYVRRQLDQHRIQNYQRISAVDGFTRSASQMEQLGLTVQLSTRQGLAGCAASHIELWKRIVEQQLDWCLILEDDVNFHPQFTTLFSAYWEQVPKNARIVFLGYCGADDLDRVKSAVVSRPVMCTHAYMVNHVGAKFLLDHLLPVNQPIDIAISTLFKKLRGSYVFNGSTQIAGIRSHDYKEANGGKCTFNGIVFQNQQDQGSTIHQLETVY